MSSSSIQSSKNSDIASVLKERALVKGVEVTLASGAKSGVYVDCKRATLHGPSLRVIGQACADFFAAAQPRPQMIAGVSVGGDPLVAAVILAAADRGWELDGLLVRKEAKSHGMSKGRAVDGTLPRAGAAVWLLEDVITSGGSSLTAAQHLKAEGYELAGILTLVDREAGGVQKLEQELRIPVQSLTRLGELEHGRS